ncbi:copper transport protein ctr1 [Chytriomyces hyalinus]|nr:copper transport protein ctr1 [Chytriomyces hyalinus]
MTSAFSQVQARATMAVANDSNAIDAAELAAIVREAADAAKCVQLMDLIEKRLANTATRNWRQTAKTLQLLEALLRAGSLVAAKYAQDHLMGTLDTLRGLYFDDDDVPDAAMNIRNLSKKIQNAIHEIPVDKESPTSATTHAPPPNSLAKAVSPTTATTAPSQQLPPVPQPKLPIRIWTDLSGSFKVEARFLAIAEGNMVTLERPNGEQMGIMMDKMCSADLDYILGLKQQGIEVKKVTPTSRAPATSHPKQPQSAITADKKLQPKNSSDNTTAKSTLPPGFIIPSTALKIDLTPSGKLGAGTSGIVRKATYSNTTVAVKIISVLHLTKPQREAVIKEAEIMSRIVHPNAVRLFGVMIEEGRGLGLVMELLPRGCLKDYVETAPIPSLAQRIRLARDVSQAMAYLHDTLNMVHRDLKALNVLLDDSGVFLRAKVCDFGFAHVKSLGMDSSFWTGPSSAPAVVAPGKDEFTGGAIRGLKIQAAISMGSMTVNGGMGTPLWMAPELFDMNALISKPADVYAYTIVMTEIFSWAGPYCIAYEKIIPIMQNVISVVQSGRRPDLNLSPDVPPAIRSLIEAGWDQNPDLRPTFRDITRVLEKAKSEADYQSLYAPPPVPMGQNPMTGRTYNADQSTHQMQQPMSIYQQHQQIQPLDNMAALQRSLPPQSAHLSSSAPLLGLPGNYNGFSLSPISPPYSNANNPFRDPSGQQQQQQQQPGLPNASGYSLQQIGRSPSPSHQSMYHNNPNNNNNSMLNGSTTHLQQPQQFQHNAISPGRKGVSLSNLGPAVPMMYAGASGPPPVLQRLPKSNPQTHHHHPDSSYYMQQRPQSQPTSEMMIPGSRHAVYWDVEETAGWFLMMGEGVDVVAKCKELHVDGKTLMTLTDRDFAEKLGVSDAMRRRRLCEMVEDYRITCS